MIRDRDHAAVTDSSAEPLRLLIIGLGKSGQRFLRAISYMQSHDPWVSLHGVCDVDRQRLDIALPPGTHRFRDVEEVLEHSDVDIACICVNEIYHFEVLHQLCTHGRRPRRVICEKPLTETLAQCHEVQRLYEDHEITVNFPERHSPLLDDFLKWREGRDLETRRVEFFWGKFRVGDRRPTTGDTSEITHALDLTRFLTGTPVSAPVEILDCNLSFSDFSPFESSLLDGIDIHLLIDGSVPVNGHSSFVWEKRRRRLVLYLAEKCPEAGAGRFFQAVFDFDAPVWDDDALHIHEISPADGSRTLVFEATYAARDFPPPLYKVRKIYRFLQENVRSLLNEGTETHLAHLSSAVWIQEILEQIQQTASRSSSFVCRLKS